MQNIVWKLKKLINYQKCIIIEDQSPFSHLDPRIQSSKFIALYALKVTAKILVD